MKQLPNLTLFALLLFSSFFLNSCKKQDKKESSIKEEVATVTYDIESNNLCEESWFPHSQTPAPEEGKGSPFDVSSTTNAIFHQWSWQKFLWLTKPTYGAQKLPLFLDPDELTQVTSHMNIVPQKDGASVVLKYINQAGSDEGILVTNPDYSSLKKTETVFYSIHVDPIMMNAAEKFKDSIIQGSLKKKNLSSFPVGSLELKVSWVNKNAIAKEKIKDYFTTMAAVTTDGTTYTNTEVALLGMHVVGVVENHPEFIWATFEHDDLAPNYNWKENKTSSTTDKLLFEKGSTTGIAGIKFDKISKQAKEKYKVFDLFKYGVPRDNTGAFMKTSQSEPINFNNIENINICVKKNLKDVWKNYFYNGSIWIDTDGLTPKKQVKLLVSLKDSIANATPGSKARGSLNCANVTMETFTQTFQSDIKDINVGTLTNCFSCHNSGGFPAIGDSPLYMSHIFDSYVKRAEGKTASEVESLKAKHEVMEFMRANLK